MIGALFTWPPAADHVPAAQLVQLEALRAEPVPAAQFAQTVELAGAHVPAAQGVGALVPAVAQAEPLGHGWHALALAAAAYDPGAHA
jgi:hypothetical protein